MAVASGPSTNRRRSARWSTPSTRISQPPAARTLRDQPDWFPKVSGMTNVSQVSRAPAGVTRGRPERRPTCRICAAILMCLRPASLIMTGLSSSASGRRPAGEPEQGGLAGDRVRDQDRARTEVVNRPDHRSLVTIRTLRVQVVVVPWPLALASFRRARPWLKIAEVPAFAEDPVPWPQRVVATVPVDDPFRVNDIRAAAVGGGRARRGQALGLALCACRPGAAEALGSRPARRAVAAGDAQQP